MLDLKKLIICPRCGALHKKRRLDFGEVALCSVCEEKLMQSCKGVEYKVLAFSFAGIIFFLIANLFSIVSIDIGGLDASMRLYEAIYRLFEEGYVLIAFFSFLVLELYPALLMVALMMYGFAMILGKKEGARSILRVVASLEEWSMVDIFFVSILVAMVKVYEYASIEFGIAFWSMAIFVAIEIYLVRFIGTQTLWEAWQRRFDEAG
ncbi:MAG: hypothetical protein GXO16_08395 [Epsilonproteobacteria bacterium]|nr:hypothetical protein [Campylobacterota bacterium]